jgi:hypothetical protein
LNITRILCAVFGVTATLAVLTPATHAHASGSDKVFVCKYVGQPNIDERLQTGDNPINVSVNAIPLDPVEVGSEFADKQGRSVVIAFDEGQPEPSANDCPTPVVPTETTVPPTTTEPAPVLQASFVSFCESILLLNEGDVTLTFVVGEPRISDVAYEVPPGSLEVTLPYGKDGTVQVNAFYGDTQVFSGVAKMPIENCVAVDVPPVPISVQVSYECVTPSFEPSGRMGRLTAVLDPGTQSIYAWSLHVDGLGIGQRQLGTDAIVIDIPHPMPGSYGWYVSIEVTPTKGGDTDPDTFEVYGDCSLFEPDTTIYGDPVVTNPPTAVRSTPIPIGPFDPAPPMPVTNSTLPPTGSDEDHRNQMLLAATVLVALGTAIVLTTRRRDKQPQLIG